MLQDYCKTNTQALSLILLFVYNATFQTELDNLILTASQLTTRCWLFLNDIQNAKTHLQTIFRGTDDVDKLKVYVNSYWKKKLDISNLKLEAGHMVDETIANGNAYLYQAEQITDEHIQPYLKMVQPYIPLIYGFTSLITILVIILIAQYCGIAIFDMIKERYTIQETEHDEDESVKKFKPRRKL